MDFSTLSIEEILAYAAERRAFAEGIAAQDAPSLAEIAQAEEALAEEEAALAAAAEAEGNEPAPADAVASLRTRMAAAAEDEETEVEAAEDEDEGGDPEDEPEEEPEPEPEPAPVQARGSRVANLARKTTKPKGTESVQTERRITLTAAAEVPNYASGQELSGMAEVTDALVSRVSAFPTPQGKYDFDDKRYKPDFRFSGVAKINLAFDDELQIHTGKDHLSVLAHANDETRLESAQGKGSLVAAGGWCTPSENLYDLCEGETLEGLATLPEVSVDRGGINFTKGPDFATLFADANFGWFKQTEAQAIAGTTKACFELTCPAWTDVRLDAVGLCLRVPILTNAAFPELTQRITRGAMVAHQHKMNADVIGRMVTIAGAATAGTDWTSTAQSLLENLERIADIKRARYKFAFDHTMEVMVPYWVKGALRNDFALRGGRPLDAVTDAYMTSEFATRNLNVQYVYDWQEMDADTVTAGYPNTVNILMYPAGTYTKGVSDVINVSAVYDAASLAVNVFTGLFFEQGLLVANTCFDADLITITLCGSGHTGIANINVCGVDATP